MNTRAANLQVDQKDSRHRGWFQTALLNQLAALEEGHLVVRDGSSEWRFGESSADAELHCEVTVHKSTFYRYAILNGGLGVGEAYVDGLWSCDDLTALVQIFVRNRDLLDTINGGLARLARPMMSWFHYRNRNTEGGSRRNIAAHYDLGNELFALFLDDNMMYSSAIYRSETDTLEQASTRKLDCLCQKLALKPTDHLLEIGTGWGGMAIHAASHFGCRVTTTTISQQQFDLATQRVAEAGLADRVTVLLRDYRELEGRYDKLVSIEMVEAVGHQFLDTYFAKCASLLKPEGLMAMQAITIEDQRYTKALKTVDFIKRFIFPGSFIPAVSILAGSVARASDMKLYDLEDIGYSYALTLREWRRRFQNNIDKVSELGYPERFVRMWEFYFCYCEGGFLERQISDVQMLLTKPRAMPARTIGMDLTTEIIG